MQKNGERMLCMVVPRLSIMNEEKVLLTLSRDSRR